MHYLLGRECIIRVWGVQSTKGNAKMQFVGRNYTGQHNETHARGCNEVDMDRRPYKGH